MDKRVTLNEAPPPYQAVSQYSYQDPRQMVGQQPQQGYGTVNNAYSHTTIIQQHSVPLVVVGGCPSCRVGVLEDDYTCLGVCCAIIFFPIGIICCLAMKERRCPNCGAVFG